MSATNKLMEKSNDIMDSNYNSNEFPCEFEHMKNINLTYVTEYKLKISLSYETTNKNSKEFIIHGINNNNKLILVPTKFVDNCQTKLLEKNGPFKIKQ